MSGASEEWQPFQQGSTLGARGSERGVILRDEEHREGARITLERPTWFQRLGSHKRPFSITCGVYGWMLHTRFFASLREAEAEYTRMQSSLSALIASYPADGDPDFEAKRIKAEAACKAFLVAFP